MKKTKGKESFSVLFYTLPETTKTDLFRVIAIAKVLCQDVGGCAAKTPFRVTSPSLEKKAKKTTPTCNDGWIMIYEFGTIKDAKKFAEDISLLKPICGVEYSGGRFKTCIVDKWTECLVHTG